MLLQPRLALKWHFSLGYGLSSKAIAWFSSGFFSHVDWLLPYGYLLGARSDRVGGKPAGVEIRPRAYEKWKKVAVLSLEVSEGEYGRFYDFMLAQLHKPYDSTAIWGFAAGRDWRQDDSWFCSELQTAGLEAAGIIPKLYMPANKITPVSLVSILSAKGAKLEYEGTV